MTTPAPEIEPAIEIIGVRKSYGHVPVVRDLDLTIGQGEFFSLLGPSGCGKTTTLRMLAGFEFPDEGDIRLDGRSVRDLPANRRPLNMVFQRYELFPHMTVRRNVGYGLKVQRRPKREIAERVDAMLETVGVGELADRRADQLSGGQQQRVALARALVNNPKALLLDEPLSALDVKLRKRMQFELKAIQRDLGTTFVYVTHDQEEAFLMSDRIGIMNHGRLLQVGTPQEIYETPADAFVADFVGQLNSFEVEIAADDRNGHHGDARVTVIADIAPGTNRFAVRPERVVVAGGGDATSVPGVITERIYLGPVRHYVVDTTLGKIVMQGLPDGADFQVDDPVVLTWPDDALIHLGAA